MTKQWSIYYFFFKDFQDINKDEPNAVLVGLAPDQMNYEKLTTAFRLIKEKNAPLIAINKSRYIQTKDGLSLGPGIWNFLKFLKKKFKFFGNFLKKIRISSKV